MPGLGMVTIRRQVLEVDLRSSEADGHDLQRRLSAVCADVLSPAIEAALVAIDPGNTYLYLDRLAIDLTFTTLDGFDAELAEAVQRELKDHFRRHPVHSVGEDGTAGDPADRGAVEQRTTEQMMDDALVTFLRTGRLPWAFRLPPGKTLEQFVLEMWDDGSGHRDPAPTARQRLQSALANPVASERLARQFTPGFVTIVLRSLSAELVASVLQVESALTEAGPAPAWRAFSRTVRQVALQAAAVKRTVTPGQLAREAWAGLGPAHRGNLTLASAVEHEWPESTTDVASPPGTDRMQPSSERPVTATDRGADFSGSLVDNAGLVLLHPFLPRFLAGLGITVGDDLVDPDRALCLLHHLATGEPTAPEHQLTLAKALCGVPSEMPSVADVGLTPAETAETAALLDAAIGHWDVLRGTSPDTLRLEFLRRPGVLTVTSDGDWLLRVDARTVDILLDQLPWGYSSFRLPWMSRLMMVEWR